MDNWKETTLADICSDISYGYTESATQEKIGPRFLRITDIAKGRLVWDNVPFCPISESNFEKYKLNPGDIVIARTGATTGANYTIKENDPNDVVYASYLIRYQIDNSTANPFFIGHILQSNNWKDYVDAIKGGSAQPGANAKQLGSYPFNLPPLTEQKAIAEVLSSLDDKIDLLHRQNKTLEAMAETLFRQWFVEEADESWEEKPLSEIFKVGIGRTPPRKEFHWFSKNTKDVKWISIKDMGESGLFIFDTSEYLTNEAVETFRIPIIPKGTVVLSFKMTLGRIGITTEDMLSNEAIAHFLPMDDLNVSNEYLYFFLKTFPYQTLGSTSSIVTSINSGMIKSLPLTIPPVDLMSRFNEKARPNFKKIRFNQQQIQTLTKLRDTLLPKLMSGEVRVKMN